MKHLFKAFIFLFISGTASAQNKSAVPPAEFEKAIQATNAQLLDIRTADEYQAGYIKGAVSANWQNDEQFQYQVNKLDKSKPVYLYCLSGVRSDRAANWLIKNGFTKVINLEGGIKEWIAAGKPTKKGVD